jgi:2-hydroxychromene-2-carboxylate isomerase
MRLDWYFDFISPFAYLQFTRLGELPPTVELRLQPVLLAGILNHWGQLGPAEIEPKRHFTYQHVMWLAQQAGVPFTMPVGHPFNSLPLLRLALALGATREVVGRLFSFVWVDGHIPQQPEAWALLLGELGVGDGTEAPPIKERLRQITEAAQQRGVFGVPTSIIGGELFWGYDATDMLLDYCRFPAAFTGKALRRAADVPVVASRSRQPRQPH